MLNPDSDQTEYIIARKRFLREPLSESGMAQCSSKEKKIPYIAGKSEVLCGAE